MASEKKVIWLDVDPGHDDAFALMLAFGSDKLQVLGVSSVYGNQSLDKTTRNARRMLTLCNATNVPLIRGSARPLVAPTFFCPEIHGESGLELSSTASSSSSDAFSSVSSPELLRKLDEECQKAPAPTWAEEEWLAEIYHRIMASPVPVHMCCTGTLTNLALLLRVYPRIVDNLVQIVLLGGAAGLGNITPAAEFNILLDPEAAHVVFHLNNEKVPVVQIPLEVSHTTLVTASVFQSIAALDSNFSRFAVDLLSFFRETYRKVFFMPDPPLHDPLVIAYIIDPSLFCTTPTVVDVALTGTGAGLRGRTLVDVFNMEPEEKKRNVLFAKSVSVEAFWQLMLDGLRAINSSTLLNSY